MYISLIESIWNIFLIESLESYFEKEIEKIWTKTLKNHKTFIWNMR